MQWMMASRVQRRTASGDGSSAPGATCTGARPVSRASARGSWEDPYELSRTRMERGGDSARCLAREGMMREAGSVDFAAFGRSAMTGSGAESSVSFTSSRAV